MLNTVGRLGVAIVVALAICVGAWDAVAQAPAAPVILIFNSQKVQRDAAAMKSIRGQMEAQRKSYQGTIAKLENELREGNKELQRKRAILSPEAFGQERDKLQQRAAEVQREVQKIRRTLERAVNVATGEVQKRVLEVISKITVERGANLVLPHELVVFFRDGQNLDITKDVLGRVDKELPQVQLKVVPVE